MANSLKLSALFLTAAATFLFHTDFLWVDGVMAILLLRYMCINGKMCSKTVL